MVNITVKNRVRDGLFEGPAFPYELKKNKNKKVKVVKSNKKQFFFFSELKKILLVKLLGLVLMGGN